MPLNRVETLQLEEALLDLRGHPRLTRKEEQIVLLIQREFEELGRNIAMPPNRWAVLEAMLRKIAAPEPEESEELLDAEEAY